LPDEATTSEKEALTEIGIEFICKGIETSIEMAEEDGYIDFTDQLYMPVYLKKSFFKYAWLACDECQDCSVLRRIMMQRMLTGRLLAVGDAFQAIMGFASAASDSMERVKEDFDCHDLFLTVSFRCDRAIVDYARQWSPMIEAREDAGEGSVKTIEEPEWDYADLRPSDAILCRNTKPLVSLAFRLIGKGIACHVEGREIGKGLIDLCKKWKKCDTIELLREKLESYAETQISRFLKKHQESRAQLIQDKVGTIYILMNGLADDEPVCLLEQKIYSIFKDNEQTLTLSTIHKAKGREWDRVFWIGKNLYNPSRYARQDWEIQQESNLMFVASTRARHELVIVNLKMPARKKRIEE
jgi:DNA helicase II / ATP-dependent DNA helicase PcrA